MFTLIFCPNELVAKLDAPILLSYTSPLGKSIPVFAPNPNLLWYSTNFFAPKSNPILIRASLHEYANACFVVIVPCPETSWHLIVNPPTTSYPSQKYVLFLVVFPSSYAAAIVNGLIVEPGSNESLTQKFFHLELSASEISFSERFSCSCSVYLNDKSHGSFKLNVVLSAIANISPVLGSAITAASLFGWYFFIYFFIAFWTILCIFMSIVDTTVSPLVGSLITVSILLSEFTYPYSRPLSPESTSL